MPASHLPDDPTTLRPLSQLSARELEAGPLATIPVAADIADGSYMAARVAEMDPADAFPRCEPSDEDAPGGLTAEGLAVDMAAIEHGYPLPEDRGSAVVSPLGWVEYVEDLIRPGRIVVVAAEEGTGKSYAIAGELGIRLAVAGGAFAGTWPILQTGPVLVLSEMHADDDYQREEAILEALELSREALRGAYYRLALASAARDRPALQVRHWREWIVEWLRERGALLVVFDTATAAAQVDPWGTDIQAIYRSLRAMIEAYPDLAIVLVVHLKKPQGRGERRISDVLGEWGRWCDVVLLMEADGLERVKLTTRKRVRRERRLTATKAGGLLIDPRELTGSGPKVPAADVLAAVAAHPGLSIQRLAATLGVARSTARKYTDELPGIVLKPGKRGALTCHLSDGVSTGGDMSAAGEGINDVSPVTPLIQKGVTDTSLDLFPETEEDILGQLRRGELREVQP